jgi:hypothetical protein
MRVAWRASLAALLPGSALSLGALGLSLGAMGLSSGCGESTVPAPAPSSTSQVEAPPVDELGDGELAEGRALGFGFPFPVGMRLEPGSQTRVAAAGPVPFEDAANYVRARIDAAQTETGPGKTVFDQVTIKNPVGPPELRKPLVSGDEAAEVLRIEVSTTKRGWTQIVVTRSVRTKSPPGLTEDQRWERLGVRKDGKPTDPRKFE